jgi:CheY-like chemotaxis protein
MLIDDDQAVSVTLARMLEFCGHQVIRVDSAEAGLRQALASPPDALILDMKMPGMDGLEFMKHLRAAPALAAVPVGVITGDYFLGDAVLQELASLKATVRYKPIRMEDLSALTDHLLGRSVGSKPEPGA